MAQDSTGPGEQRSDCRQFDPARWPRGPSNPPSPSRVRERATSKPVKSQDSLEALYALIFAVCVLLALFLLVG